MALDASLDAALQGAAPTIFVAVRIALPEYTIRLVDGSGVVAFDSQTFTGSDDTYGVLNAVEAIEEGTGEEAPKVRISFLPPSVSAIAGLTAPGVQGSAVPIWLGAVDPATGLVIGEPELLFLGELDEADLETDLGSQLLVMDVASIWERLFDLNEGARPNKDFHQSIYGTSDENGFNHVTGVQQQLYWAAEAPSGSRNYNAGGAGGGAGGTISRPAPGGWQDFVT